MTETLYAVHDAMQVRYGDPHWWPARTPFEVMVGAVLTQNTTWRSVEKSIIALGEAAYIPSAFDALDADTLTERIRPSGFAARKAQYLTTLTGWFRTYGFSPDSVRRLPLEQVRRELLALRGIGKETADSILLYAFGFPTFVIDAYTLRLCHACRSLWERPAWERPVMTGQRRCLSAIFRRTRHCLTATTR